MGEIFGEQSTSFTHADLARRGERQSSKSTVLQLDRVWGIRAALLYSIFCCVQSKIWMICAKSSVRSNPPPTFSPPASSNQDSVGPNLEFLFIHIHSLPIPKEVEGIPSTPTHHNKCSMGGTVNQTLK